MPLAAGRDGQVQGAGGRGRVRDGCRWQGGGGRCKGQEGWESQVQEEWEGLAGLYEKCVRGV